MGGQKLVAVTITVTPGLQNAGSALLRSQAILKHCPHAAPSLNSAVLSAAVLVPYPLLYRLPYPHAPPAHARCQSSLGYREIRRRTRS